MKSLSCIARGEVSTVMAHFESEESKGKFAQSEAELEDDLIKRLERQGYEKVTIKNDDELKANLKIQLERLNGVELSKSEWRRLWSEYLAKGGVAEKTELIQERHIEVLERDSGEVVNFKFIDKDDLANNHLQVMQQYKQEDGKRRYDVTLLINGLPLVHIELKKRGVKLKKAFEQIQHYARRSFSEGSGLFEFVQIFIISNGTNTKYFSNEQAKTGGSFKFTSFFTDEKNKVIGELEEFARTFLAKRTLLSILCYYCVFDEQRKLLAMRPYQIAACEKILQKVWTSYTNELYGDRKLIKDLDKDEDSQSWNERNESKSGGYIWHTTGSGKTLTSFKSAQLVANLEGIEKVLFVVDRKDLYHQTIAEYQNFATKKNVGICIKGTQSTKDLTQKLEDDETKIIVTTIQKLALFIGSERKNNSPAFNKHTVMIFDECHRSVFGESLDLVMKYFKKFYFFGFTGTPIFTDNATKNYQTTARIFGKCLHSYTIANAIKDKNVLSFRTEHYATFKDSSIHKDKDGDERVADINSDEVIFHPKRIENIVAKTLECFDTQTQNRKFNALFAVSSIKATKIYYDEFKKQLSQLPEEKRLNVGMIYSAARKDDESEENNESTAELEKSAKDALTEAINDYNEFFKTSFDADGEFSKYYQDFTRRLKGEEKDGKRLDLAIVVEMLLTGFDSKGLNTLFVDKNLKYHGLIQAFSRTNRILNSQKSHGNIICFRGLEENMNEALRLFGEVGAAEVVFLKSFKHYVDGYESEGKKYPGYKELVERLKSEFSLDNFHENVAGARVKDFIELFNAFIRLRNILTSFGEDFIRLEEKLLSEREFQDYRSHYLDIRERKSEGEKDKENKLDEMVFEIELLKVVEVTLDYIISLISELLIKNDERIKEHIIRALNSSVNLRAKEGLILSFIEHLQSKPNLIRSFIENFNANDEIERLLKNFAQEEKKKGLAELIAKFNLKEEATQNLMQKAFENNEFNDRGKEFADCLPFGHFSEDYTQKKAQIYGRLLKFFERFRDF